MRYTNQMRVQAQGQDTRLLQAFASEQTQGVGQALEHFIGGVFLHRANDGVIDFQVVGQGHERAVLGAHPMRHIVNHPVKDIFDALLFQNVGCVVRFAKAWAEPAFGTLASESLNHVEAGHNLPFFAIGMVQCLLMHTVANEFPTRLVHGFCCARIGLNDAGIEAGGGRQAAAADGFNDAG